MCLTLWTNTGLLGSILMVSIALSLLWNFFLFLVKWLLALLSLLCYLPILGWKPCWTIAMITVLRVVIDQSWTAF